MYENMKWRFHLKICQRQSLFEKKWGMPCMNVSMIWFLASSKSHRGNQQMEFPRHLAINQWSKQIMLTNAERWVSAIPLSKWAQMHTNWNFSILTEFYNQLDWWEELGAAPAEETEKGVSLSARIELWDWILFWIVLMCKSKWKWGFLDGDCECLDGKWRACSPNCFEVGPAWSGGSLIPGGRDTSGTHTDLEEGQCLP